MTPCDSMPLIRSNQGDMRVGVGTPFYAGTSHTDSQLSVMEKNEDVQLRRRITTVKQRVSKESGPCFTPQLGSPKA